jgi:hypothetical protein
MNLWYSEAVEVLLPLRWHLNELIEEIESHNRYAKSFGGAMISEAKIAAAKTANEEVDKFFCPKLQTLAGERKRLQGREHEEDDE